MPTVNIPLRNELIEIPRLAAIVEAFGEEHDISSDVILCVNLALDEIVTNIMSYAYDDVRPHEILVHLSLDRGELAVRVEDDGRPFNPLGAPPVDLDAELKDRPIGGLGIQIVRSVMDALDHRRENGRNILTMRKAAGTPPRS